jgi:16S rRNA (cytidine1402-2'-O)-methyltransferase
MLYVIPTPIGNLDDMTIRSLEIIKNCHTLICEDPRNTAQLLQLLKIEKTPKLIQYVSNHNFNYSKIYEALSQDLINDSQSYIGLVSDAGSPCLSDPGREVIQIAIELGLKYSVLPGANAVIPAVAASGFVAKEFSFMGFLPVKKGRNKNWNDIIRSQYPIVLFESKHRINKLIEEIKSNLDPQRKLCICREISKLHESIWSGKVGQLDEYQLVDKGEFVVVIDRFQKSYNKDQIEDEEFEVDG